MPASFASLRNVRAPHWAQHGNRRAPPRARSIVARRGCHAFGMWACPFGTLASLCRPPCRGAGTFSSRPDVRPWQAPAHGCSTRYACVSAPRWPAAGSAHDALLVASQDAQRCALWHSRAQRPRARAGAGPALGNVQREASKQSGEKWGRVRPGMPTRHSATIPPGAVPNAQRCSLWVCVTGSAVGCAVQGRLSVPDVHTDAAHPPPPSVWPTLDLWYVRLT